MKYTFKDRQNRLPPAKLSGVGAVLGKPDDPMIIRVDTREQLPCDFDSSYILTTCGTIPVGDYSIEGDEDSFSVERKSLSDFVQAVSLSKNWIRELNKIAKMKERNLVCAYILECSFDDIKKFDYSIFSSGAITSQFVYRRVAQLIYEYNCHVVFAGSREGGAYAVALLLKRRKESLRTNLKGEP